MNTGSKTAAAGQATGGVLLTLATGQFLMTLDSSVMKRLNLTNGKLSNVRQMTPFTSCNRGRASRTLSMLQCVPRITPSKPIASRLAKN